MKLTDLSNEFDNINEAPPGGWLNTKASLGKIDNYVQNTRIARGLDAVATKASTKYGGAHGNKKPIDPKGGIDDKETDDWINKGDTSKKDDKPKDKATAPKPNAPEPKKVSDLKPGSAYNDGTATWTWTGTDWSDGAVKLDPETGFKQFKKAKNKFVKEVAGPDKCWDGYKKAGTQKGTGKNKGKRVNKCVPEAPGAPDVAPDPKLAQQVAQKATALKGVIGGKASGAQVAKGLDKISSGETLPPNIIKAIAPYATAIQSMMSNPQLFGKFKALMKQAEAGQNQAEPGPK